MENIHTNNELPILSETIKLYEIFYKHLELFPKKDKYMLGAKCEQYMSAILELLIAARWQNKQEKATTLKQASLKFDALKIFIRMLKNLMIIDDKKYLRLQAHIQEIGKMFGGWLNSLK